ncbi:MAG TPA: aspartyl/asparaginyl beta-hydroxylase domain-containing protein [Steroidobacteraceae bacterium]|nr:aspartyl/asparaginyl beta-hydroxylase domain-containing protein [Steroidobacteraceae bacterium]
MSDKDAVAASNATALQLVQAAKAATAAGRNAEADELLARAARLAPAHPAVLNELGLSMMRYGRAGEARGFFERATAADPRHPALWSNLASSLHALRLTAEEAQAVERALTLEPRHVPALLQKGALLEDRGETRQAARLYRDALALVPPDVTPPATLAAALERARDAVRRDDAALARAIEERLADIRDSHGGGEYRRMDRCIDLLTGRRNRYAPQPTFLYYPELPAVEFFERAQFPWLDAIEATTDAICSELTAVLSADPAGLTPYVAYPDDAPLAQWRELNKSRRWSAYFLWNEGIPQGEHLARCPRTAEALKGAPLCDIAQHGPSAFFSILEPGTHIPPHTGVTNARVTVHLPLIVPRDCAFRVGSEIREWVPGKAWVFDDTIEHEAWNRSDTPRAILIFDIWNPYLSRAERDLVRGAIEVIGAYRADGGARHHEPTPEPAVR